MTRRLTLGRRPSYRLCPAVARALASWRPGTGTPRPGGRCTGCTPGSRSCCAAGSDSDRHGNGAVTSAVAGQDRSLARGAHPLPRALCPGCGFYRGAQCPGPASAGGSSGPVANSSSRGAVFGRRPQAPGPRWAGNSAESPGARARSAPNCARPAAALGPHRDTRRVTCKEPKRRSHLPPACLNSCGSANPPPPPWEGPPVPLPSRRVPPPAAPLPTRDRPRMPSPAVHRAPIGCPSRHSHAALQLIGTCGADVGTGKLWAKEAQGRTGFAREEKAPLGCKGAARPRPGFCSPGIPRALNLCPTCPARSAESVLNPYRKPPSPLFFLSGRSC